MNLMDPAIVTIIVAASGAVLTIIGTLLLALAARVSQDLRRLTDSVETLNVKMAMVAERTDGHEHRIGRLENQTENLLGCQLCKT